MGLFAGFPCLISEACKATVKQDFRYFVISPFILSIHIILMAEIDTVKKKQIMVVWSGGLGWLLCTFQSGLVFKLRKLT